MIPLSVPHIAGNEHKYVTECLNTEWVSSAGSYVDKFENDICNYTGAKHAVACTNGTAALQVALKIVGVVANDEVIVPTVTFISPINAVSLLHAKPVFMDCDDYYNIDIHKTIEFIEKNTITKNGQTINKKTNRRISAIVPVHVFGNAVDLTPLIPVCRDRNIKIVEDACEAVGTRYISGALNGRHAGTIGDMGCYSFNGNKIITTGGGGMIVTNHPEYAQRAKYLTTQAKDDPVRYIHHDIGYNFRLANVPAAMGVAQLERLNAFIRIKTDNFQHYKKEIDGIPGLQLANVPAYSSNNHWMYALQIDPNEYGRDRETVMALLSENGIQTRPLWHLCHLQRPYHDHQAYHITRAHALLKKTLNIPCSVNLTGKDISRVIGCLNQWKK